MSILHIALIANMVQSDCFLSYRAHLFDGFFCSRDVAEYNPLLCIEMNLPKRQSYHYHCIMKKMIFLIQNVRIINEMDAGFKT